MYKKALLYILLTSLTITLILPAVSAISDKDWSLKITDFSGNSITLSYNDILFLPQTTVTAQLSCYGQPLANGEWQGVKLSDLLNIEAIDSEVTSIDFKAQDGYEVSIPITTALEPNTIVAYALDNGALNEGLRLVLPSENGNLWIAQIISISMSNSNPGEGVSSNPNDALARIEQSYPTPQPTMQTQQPKQPTPTPNQPTTQPNLPIANNTEIQPTQISSEKKSGNLNDIEFGLVVLTVTVFAVSLSVMKFRKHIAASK